MMGNFRVFVLPVLSGFVLSACVSSTLDLSDENTSQSLQETQTAETQTQAPEPASTPSRNSIDASASSQECAIYFQVMTKLAIENRTTAKNVAEGCRPETDTGPNINPISPAQASSQSDLARVFKHKLISRGTPADLADQVIRSKAFADLIGAS